MAHGLHGEIHVTQVEVAFGQDHDELKIETWLSITCQSGIPKTEFES